MSDHAKTITVLYFAAASTATGITSEEVPIPESGLKLLGLTELLVSRHPNVGLKEIIDASQWSVDLEMVDDPETILLKGGEEVAVICPVSGG
ncbi:Molybdopterin synthase sulfur carrier subunit [Psilocybe cubensis]|uniref:Molybdopterin synthase sulfur carrier subunit n=2 Tax=Psilocybe cubensis TaxID=181762 RepID=A0ACB8H1S9_PSICU|nr:Molybdopterin synthase sulfur carrier subunit [Psilocybe cubensis]KAH9481436.1 Molybdopterin synthase sulfur carrier subunit [Psilocybe cubensis]